MCNQYDLTKRAHKTASGDVESHGVRVAVFGSNS